MARAFGSYPKCRWFKSICRYHVKSCFCSFYNMCGPLVKRLRHRPFTAVSRVRFSHGSPKNGFQNWNPFFALCGFFLWSGFLDRIFIKKKKLHNFPIFFSNSPFPYPVHWERITDRRMMICWKLKISAGIMEKKRRWIP